MMLAEGGADRLQLRLSDELSHEPRDWVVIASLERIADDQAITLEPDLAMRLEGARDADHSLLSGMGECARCAYDTVSCQLNGAMICGLGINLTPVGDVAGLTRAGVAYAKGEPVDRLDAGLSAVGLTATALVVASGGTSISIKLGAGFLKFAHLTGRMPVAVTRALRRAGADGIDWAALPAVRSTGDLGRIVRMDALRPAALAAGDMGRIAAKAGPQQALHLLEGTENLGDVRRVALASDSLTDRTAGYFEIFGKSRILRVTARLADEVIGAIFAAIGIAGAALSALASGAGSMLTRRLRRHLR